MNCKRNVTISLVFLTPLAIVFGAIYEIFTNRKEAALYLIFIALPGAVVAALDQLKRVLPPDRLRIDDRNHAYALRGEKPIRPGSSVSRQVTDIVIPIRLLNIDSERAIDVLDITTEPLDEGIEFSIPEMEEVLLGNQVQHRYIVADECFSELFNDGTTKTIEAMKIKDYVICLREYHRHHSSYRIRLTFRDNFGREYSKDIRAQIAVRIPLHDWLK